MQTHWRDRVEIMHEGFHIVHKVRFYIPFTFSSVCVSFFLLLLPLVCFHVSGEDMTSSSTHFSPKSASPVLTTVCLSASEPLLPACLPVCLTVGRTAEPILLKHGTPSPVPSSKGHFSCITSQCGNPCGVTARLHIQNLHRKTTQSAVCM